MAAKARQARPNTIARVDREIDWLDACRRMAARQADLFAPTRRRSPSAREYEGRGEGGDMTLKLDRQCEDIVFEELERHRRRRRRAARPSARSAARSRSAAASPSHRVVIDPIDGSMNVRRTIPSHSLSIAVADGDSMADVHFGFVHDFGAGEEFSAVAAAAPTVDGVRIEPPPRAEMPLEVVGLESADPRWIVGAIEQLAGQGLPAPRRSARSRSR